MSRAGGWHYPRSDLRRPDEHHLPVARRHASELLRGASAGESGRCTPVPAKRDRQSGHHLHRSHRQYDHHHRRAPVAERCAEALPVAAGECGLGAGGHPHAGRLRLSDSDGGALVFSPTLRVGYSPVGSRFLPAGSPASPRRPCPAQWILLAALASLSRTFRSWCRRGSAHSSSSGCAPHSLSNPGTLYAIYAGATPPTRLPAHATFTRG